MNNIFVFCIGGTGLRVMKSLIMLLAAGEDINNFNVVPILIDPHKDLAELKNLKKTLEDYQKINIKLKTGGTNQQNAMDGFFKTSILSLNEMDGLSSGDFDFDQREDKAFGELINLNAFKDNDINRQMIELLYSPTNLSKPLSVGFKGSPNVGCVVLNETIENAQWFKTFEGSCKKGDKIFIISSIFGGTGASGFPLLVKKIKKSSSDDVKNAPIGALTVLPYFDLTDPAANAENKEIDSSNFATKTKAALSYYNKEVAVDSLYYIGDTPKERYENNEMEQENNAHVVELIGATSILNFANKPKPSSPQYPGISIEKDEEVLDVTNMGTGYKTMIKRLADLHILSLLVKFVPTELQLPIRKTLGINENTLFNTDDFRLLEHFTDETFQKWIKELNENKRSFSPLILDIDVENTFETPVRGKQPNLEGFLFKKIPFGISYYVLEMIKAGNKMPDEERQLENHFRYFMYCSYQAINTIHEDLIN